MLPDVLNYTRAVVYKKSVFVTLTPLHLFYSLSKEFEAVLPLLMEYYSAVL